VCTLDPYAAEAAEQRVAARYLLLDRDDFLEAALACRPLPPIPWARLAAQCCEVPVVCPSAAQSLTAPVAALCAAVAAPGGAAADDVVILL
jgi:hypothetical protein